MIHGFWKQLKMATHVIRVRAKKAEVLKLLRSIPQVARGNGAAAQALMTRMGLELLGRIRDAFVTKARGGTDEAGESWKPLKKTTVAYSRRHPGLPPSKARARWRPSYALTKQGREKWWKNYSHYLAIYNGDKAHAAAVAWLIAKGDGEKTLLENYGDTPVEILRDTGLLLNSLSPGVRGRNKVFRVKAGEVIVGTNRKHAAVHHYGSRDRRIPQRRLWPEPKKWPSNWWTAILEQAKAGLIDIVLWMFRTKVS